MKKILFVVLLFLTSSFSALIGKETKYASDFCLLTIPRSGSHLATKCLAILSGKKPTFPRFFDVQRLSENPNVFLWTHFQIEKTVNEMFALPNRKYIFNLRDLRDIAIARNYHLSRWPHPPFDKKTPLTETWFDLSFNDQLNALVMPEVWGMNPYYHDTLVLMPDIISLMQRPNVYVTSFEKLVGPKGGGTEIEQIQEILNLATFLNIEITEEEAREIGESLFGGTATFHKGLINQWKEIFNEENVNLYKERIGEFLIQLGFEQNYNW